MLHQLEPIEDGELRCTVCGQRWTKQPGSYCPGVMVYRWGAWPEHLLTKKQMDEAGLQTGKRLPPPAGLCFREKSPDGKMWLYDRNQGVPKAQPTEAQQAALAKAQANGKRVDVYCDRCGRYIFTTTAKKRDQGKAWICFVCEDHDEAIQTAQDWLILDALILDTETTGLDYSAQPVQIAVTTMAGEVLLDTLVKPTVPVSEKARSIHGITDEQLATAPDFPSVYPRLVELLASKPVIIYNAEYDDRILYQACRAHGLPELAIKGLCAMTLYSQWFGAWSERHKDYTYQSLPGGDHSAVGDCRATLRLLQSMAANKDETEDA